MTKPKTAAGTPDLTPVTRRLDVIIRLLLDRGTDDGAAADVQARALAACGLTSTEIAVITGRLASNIRRDISRTGRRT